MQCLHDVQTLYKKWMNMFVFKIDMIRTQWEFPPTYYQPTCLTVDSSEAHFARTVVSIHCICTIGAVQTWCTEALIKVCKIMYDGAMAWKRFPHCWWFYIWGWICWSSLDSPHKRPPTEMELWYLFSVVYKNLYYDFFEMHSQWRKWRELKIKVRQCLGVKPLSEVMITQFLGIYDFTWWWDNDI